MKILVNNLQEIKKYIQFSLIMRGNKRKYPNKLVSNFKKSEKHNQSIGSQYSGMLFVCIGILFRHVCLKRRVNSNAPKSGRVIQKFESIDYLCQCMSMLILMRLVNSANIYENVSRIFE